MECNNCLIRELRIEIKIDGGNNLPIIPDVIRHINRRHIRFEPGGDSFLINESGAREFFDFCQDHMNPDDVYFRIDDQPWRPILEMGALLEMQWIDEVLRNESIICYFQPIVNRDKDIFAYEILSRFQREDGSLIYPNEIFTAARSRGRLYALDRLCRMTAVKSAVTLNKKVFINFIPTSIYSPEFCLKSTVHLANSIGIDPAQFVFEVVETEKVEDLDHLKKILAYYREKGFQYALDDVGEGYSTIELLSELMPQYMKLDMKYVQGVANDLEKQHTANTFLDRAIKLGSIPLAEGVEEKEDFEWLKQRGYQLFQGYYFGKPAPSPRE